MDVGFALDPSGDEFVDGVAALDKGGGDIDYNSRVNVDFRREAVLIVGVHADLFVGIFCRDSFGGFVGEEDCAGAE